MRIVRLYYVSGLWIVCLEDVLVTILCQAGIISYFEPRFVSTDCVKYRNSFNKVTNFAKPPEEKKTVKRDANARTLPVESHSGARVNILTGPPNIFVGLL